MLGAGYGWQEEDQHSGGAQPLFVVLHACPILLIPENCRVPAAGGQGLPALPGVLCDHLEGLTGIRQHAWCTLSCLLFYYLLRVPAWHRHIWMR